MTRSDFPSASYDNWKTTDPNEYHGQPHPDWPDLDVWEDRDIIEYFERLDADDWPDIDVFDLAERCGDMNTGA